MNQYCKILGIDTPPTLEVAKMSRDAKPYSLLIAVLLERGEPVTLAAAAERFEEAGIAPRGKALASLKRCKPGRPPIYRDGDFYALDPHDDEADLWAFRLGLRPPKVRSTPKAPTLPPPLPLVAEPLTTETLKRAWVAGPPHNFSAQRVAVCVLDAHREPMLPETVLAFANACGPSLLGPNSAKYWRSNAAVAVRDDGLWELRPDHKAVRSARLAVIDKLEVQQRYAHLRSTPAQMEESFQRHEQERLVRTQKLAQTHRVLIYAYPAAQPQALVLIDIGEHTIRTYVGEEITEGIERLPAYDMLIAPNIRHILNLLDVDPKERRLGDLAATQKTMTINRRGKTLKLTTELLIKSTCNIGHPFGDEKKLRNYLETQQRTKLRRRLESDAKSLYALYQYGVLHGRVCVRWGLIDESIPAPWSQRDEVRIYGLMQESMRLGRPLEIVSGNAPSWEEPWARKRTANVVVKTEGWARESLEDEHGKTIDQTEIQLARIARG